MRSTKPNQLRKNADTFTSLHGSCKSMASWLAPDSPAPEFSTISVAVEIKANDVESAVDCACAPGHDKRAVGWAAEPNSDAAAGCSSGVSAVAAGVHRLRGR